MTVRADPELGPVRWCRTCEEDWPDDEEFWGRYVIPAGAATGKGYKRKSAVSITRCRACGTNWLSPHHPHPGRCRAERKPAETLLEPLG